MLALDQALTEDADEALAKAQAIPESDFRRSALGLIVRSRAETGDPREVLKLAQGFDSPNQRLAALASFAVGLERRGAVEQSPAKSGESNPSPDRDR
jgi:hypothetical protein